MMATSSGSSGPAFACEPPDISADPRELICRSAAAYRRESPAQSAPARSPDDAGFARAHSTIARDAERRIQRDESDAKLSALIMPQPTQSAHAIRFGTFEADLPSW